MFSLCYTCGSCDAECPINRRSKQLSPRKIVRFHLLGYDDEASILPELWYCVRCGRCGRGCPMGVKPFEVIEKLKYHLAEKKSHRIGRLYLSIRDLKIRLQKARYWLIEGVFREEKISPVDVWNQAESKTNLVSEGFMDVQEFYPPRSSLERLFLKYFDFSTNLRRCFACGSCTNACPVSAKTWILSPFRVFRMVRWGLIREAASEPGIWLCIDCGRCADVCPQKVNGFWIMKLLREYAVAEKIVDNNSVRRWEFLDGELYRIYHKNIVELFSE
ncbi:MAG: 4Fe-4S dicluster domain-containing protein [Thermodesulforhabdaceae bacterium]